jgi:hypothetical protein
VKFIFRPCTKRLVEHMGLPFHKVAYLVYDVPSKMFYIKLCVLVLVYTMTLPIAHII